MFENVLRHGQHAMKARLPGQTGLYSFLSGDSSVSNMLPMSMTGPLRIRRGAGREESAPIPRPAALAANGKGKGAGIKSGEFFKTARRSGLWPEGDAVHHGALTRARKNVPWTVLRDILSVWSPLPMMSPGVFP